MRQQVRVHMEQQDRVRVPGQETQALHSAAQLPHSAEHRCAPPEMLVPAEQQGEIPSVLCSLSSAAMHDPRVLSLLGAVMRM